MSRDYKTPGEQSNQPKGGPNGGPAGKAPRPRGAGFLILLLMAMMLLVFGVFGGDSIGGGVDRLTTSDFWGALNDGRVSKIEVFAPEVGQASSYKIKGEYNATPIGEPSKFETTVGPEFYSKITEHAARYNFTYDTKTDSNLVSSLVVGLLPILLIGGLIWFLFLRRGPGGVGGPGGVFNFGRSRAKMFNKEEVKVRFKDVAGVDEAKDELSEIVQFLKNPQRFTRIGAKIPRGVVMFGPPGCGKTLLAKAIAGEAERPFFSISGSDFVEMFVGVGASRVRDLFKTARDNAPCIVFIDEIDAVGRKRGSGVGGGHDEREQTLNAILVEMDGIGTGDGIIVVAATNRPDVLDPALLRPGRFDRQVAIDLPDTKGRDAIIRVHLANVKLASDVSSEELAQATPGFSGADIANLINEAALAAVLDNRNEVQNADLMEARDKVRFGRQKKSRVMDEEDRRVTAYHEAGHAVIQDLTPNTDPVHKITIIPRGMALGATMSLPQKDIYSLSYDRAIETLQIFYGGRLAEEMFIGKITSGASNDIERATELATNMVVRYGFSKKLGPINFAETEERDFLGGGLTRVKSHSDHTANLIDTEVRSIIDENYRKAREILEQNRDKVELIAEALLVYETLDASDVRWIMNGKPIAEKKAKDREDAQRREAARKLAEAEALARQPRPDALAGRPSTDPSPA